MQIFIARADTFQVQGDVLILYVYQLKTDADGTESVAVEKVSYRKQSATAA
jgi:vacuolar protein sorting-associated protein 29